MSPQGRSPYPLVQKALEEQARIFTHFEGGIPQDLDRATKRVLALIDEHVLHADKESIMAVAVLMNCPPYIMLREKRYAAEYNSNVQDMLDIHTSRSGITADNKNLIQVYSALFIAHGENMLKKIQEMSTTDIYWLSDVREGMEEYVEDRRLVEKEIAQGLLTAENKLVQNTYAAIDARLPKNQPGIFKKNNKPDNPGL